jgi:hypothetical protein
MGKFKTQVASTLQLKFKWVRVMLIVSALVILGVLIYPRTKSMDAEIRMNSKVTVDTTMSMMVDDTTKVTMKVMGPVHRPTTQAAAPQSEELTQLAEKSDWKSTIMWCIGALNSLVLVFMNIKSLFTNKP